jgi:polysaccharide biosynthesis protein PslE
MTHNAHAHASLRDLFSVLFRHKKKVALVAFTILATVVVATIAWPRAYRSQGKILVRLGRENVTLDPTATVGRDAVVNVPEGREQEINSVVEVFKSRVLIEQAVDALGPAAILQSRDEPDGLDTSANTDTADAWFAAARRHIVAGAAAAKNWLGQVADSSQPPDEREQAVETFSRNLKVEAVRKSSVVEVTYEGRSPRLAQAAAAKLLELFPDEYSRVNRTPGSHDFLEQQTALLRGQLDGRQQELRQLREKTGLFSVAEQRKSLIDRLGRLEDESLSADAARVLAESKVRYLRSQLSALPESEVTGETTGVGNRGTEAMREQLYALEVRMHEAAAKYNETHPKFAALREQVEAARQILGQEEKTRTQVTKAPNRLHEQTKLSLLAEESQLDALRAKAAKIQTQMASLQNELKTAADSEVRIADLEREVALLETNYRKYATSREQARIDRQLEDHKISNVSVVQPATFEARPVRPRAWINFGLGAVLAVAAAVGVAWLAESLRPAVPTREKTAAKPAESAPGRITVEGNGAESARALSAQRAASLPASPQTHFRRRRVRR